MERLSITLKTKKFEQNNEAIVLNISCLPYNTKEIRVAYKSKHNFKRESQVILLMITDGEKWHYLAVKNLHRLLRGIMSNHNGSFYCLNCFHSYSTGNRLKKHERVCNDHDYCYLEMPNKDNKILKYNHREKSLKDPFIIPMDIECLIKRKHILVKMILKNLTQKEKLNIYLQVAHGL